MTTPGYVHLALPMEFEPDRGCLLLGEPQDCDCHGFRAFISAYHLRRLRWRNLSPVVERLSSGDATFARHADGRFTLESAP